MSSAAVVIGALRVNPFLPCRLFFPYKLDESILRFRGVWFIHFAHCYRHCCQFYANNEDAAFCVLLTAFNFGKINLRNSFSVLYLHSRIEFFGD